MRTPAEVLACALAVALAATLSGCHMKIETTDGPGDPNALRGQATIVPQVAPVPTVPSPTQRPSPAPSPAGAAPAPGRGGGAAEVLPEQPAVPRAAVGARPVVAPGAGGLAVLADASTAPTTVTTTMAATTEAPVLTKASTRGPGTITATHTRTTSETTSTTTGTTATSTIATTRTVTTTTLPAPKTDLYTCESSYSMPQVIERHRKGLCVDDTTFNECPDKLFGAWPHTNGERVTSLRLFKPWHPKWGNRLARQRAWAKLKEWVLSNNGKVLIGTEVSCNRQKDDQMWAWTLELLRMLGKEHVMGVAIGNEMDIFRDAKGSTDTHCNTDLWDWQYWIVLQSRVYDMDHGGFEDTKITVVWAMSVLGAIDTPFKEDEKAKVNTLLTKAWKKWGRRFIWSFNIYTIWDRSVWPTSSDDCAEKAHAAVSIDPIKGMLRAIRERIKQITGNDDDPIWVGENGWSSPAPKTVAPALRFCPEFWSLRTFGKAYANFATWDLSIGENLKGPEHVFYFTMRDSFNVGKAESFGLVHACSNSTCKIQEPPPSDEDQDGVSEETI
uniref:Uncharacterized protein n=1 Tax=Pyrodinium bahamense TaxID=73915 RepID=A0A7S0BBM8_9DINO|mmetsp:Transcript_8983/g.24987  ORF Transcript_8983/g.24987 Transcript_8983/m.24987 type:complete len:556 (+) Transcript_8983:109-1776(+)